MQVATEFFVDGQGRRCQRYHETIVTREWVEDNGQRFVSVHTDGWLTNTTKRRINDVINKYGFTVYQHRYQWYMAAIGTEHVAPFVEGMILVEREKEAA